MSFNMRKKPLLQIKLLAAVAFAVLAFTPSVGAIEPRMFYSADKAKSFKATLLDYNAKKKVVTVVSASGKKQSFPLSILSEDCQDYVLTHAKLLIISKSIRLSFEEVKEKGGGDGTSTGYAIEVNNSSDRPIDGLTLKYTLHYRQGDLLKGGTAAKTRTGKLRTEKLYSKDTLTVETGRVDIVRKSVPPSGG